MSLIFLSHLLQTDTPLYNGKGEVELKRVRSISKGDSSNNTELSLSAHAGTHVDAPFHFDKDGKTLDMYPADYWCAETPSLIDCPAEPGMILELEHLEGMLSKVAKNTDLLLIRTGAEGWRDTRRADFCEKGVGLGKDVADWIRCNLNLKFIGVDSISVASPIHREEGKAVHQALLGSHSSGSQPVLIVEDMALRILHKAPKRVSIVPLRFHKADGAMATVLAEL